MVTLADWIYEGGAKMHLGGLESIAKAYTKKHDTLYGYTEEFQKKGIRSGILAQATADTGKIYIAVLEDGTRVVISPALAWAASLLAESSDVRLEYIAKAAALPPDASDAVRSALKETYRLKTPQPMRAIVQRARPSTARPPGSGGRVNVTNPKWNAAGRSLGRIGNAAAGAVVAIEVYNIYTAPEGRTLEYTAGASGRFLGAVAGGRAGAWAGVKVGALLAAGAGQAGPQAAVPEELVTVPVGSIIGGFIGGVGGAIGGAYVGGALADETYILVTPGEGRF